MSSKQEKLLNESGIDRTKLSRPLRIVIFITFVLLSIVMSGDNGVLSAGSKNIKKDLGLSDKEYGTFGGIPSAGRIVGTLIFMGLLSTDRRKLLTVACTVMNGSLFFVYLITKNKYILFCVRFLIGSVRIYPHIYIPVWVDQFGVRKLKTIMMTIINITSPLGQTAGYAMGTFNKPEKWPYNFALVGSLILGIGTIIVVSPSKYFSARYGFVGYYENGEESEKLVPISNNMWETSVFESGDIKVKNKQQGSMLAILKQGTYIFSSYTRSVCFFCFQIIHLFITDYVNNGLKIEEKAKLFAYYGTASIFGPSLGGSFGGIVSSAFGGYEDKRSVFVVSAFGICTFLASLFVAYASGLFTFCAGVFSFFFFASALLPTIVGYVISSIPKEHKGAGSSLNLLITNLGGNLPGPIIYGFLSDHFKARDPRMAWRIVMHYFAFGLVSIFCACYFRYRDLVAKENKAKAEAEAAGRHSNEAAIAETSTGDVRLENKPTELQDLDAKGRKN